MPRWPDVARRERVTTFGWNRLSAGAKRYHIVVGLLGVAGIVGLPLLHIQVSIDPDADQIWSMALLCVGIALGQLARVRLRIGADTVELGWGEAAMIVAAALAPAYWVPVLMAIGVALKHVVVWLTGDPRTPVKMLYNVQTLTVAATVGVLATAALTQMLGRPTSGPMQTETNMVALIAGALAYTMVAVTLVAAEAHAQVGAGFRRLFSSALRGKLVMLIGNVAVGLLVVLIVCTDPIWLFFMAPGAWGLHFRYGHRARLNEEGRMWRSYAEATRELHQPDERGVAESGVRGAQSIFGADWVELHVRRLDHSNTCYALDSVGGLTVRQVGPTDHPCAEDHPAPPTQRLTQAVHQMLLIGEVEVGELWLGMPQPARLAPRELMALAAFADALSASLHDANTERELRAMTARSSYDAQHDHLTGLANRRALLDRTADAHPGPGPVVLILVNLDRFREINDTLGHAAGDEVLRLVAARLRGLTRPGEFVARLSGDEFAVLVDTGRPEAGPDFADYATCRARQIVDRLAEPAQVAGVHLVVEAAAGVVLAGAGEIDMTELLRRADLALYQAKHGPSPVVNYDGAHDAASTDRLALLAELREALGATAQLHLAIQPVIEFGTGSVIGVEALIRWRHPRRGPLTPEEFVPIVEQSELVGPFTTHVLDLALAAAASWAAAGKAVPISVNLPARCLRDAELPDRIGQLLTRHQVAATHLILEITETVVLAEVGVVDQVLARLRSAGVQLAVDDFGSGFSSLTFLTRVPVNEVKVDRTFVSRLVESPEAAAIVKTAVALCHELGMRLVAEGVETVEQRSALVGLGCTMGQGYLFYPPMAPDRIIAVLEATDRPGRSHLRGLPPPEESAG
jgi:diguanylate cyclase (GGDEF)-like protein